MPYTSPIGSALDFSGITPESYTPTGEAVNFPDAGNVVVLSGAAVISLGGLGELKTPPRLQSATGSLALFAHNADIKYYWTNAAFVNFEQNSGYEVPISPEVDFPGDFAEVAATYLRGAGTFALVASAGITLDSPFKGDASLALIAEGSVTVPWNYSHATLGLQAEGELTTWYLTGHATLGLKAFALGLNVKLPLETGVNGYPVGGPYEDGRHVDKRLGGLFADARRADAEDLTPWGIGIPTNSFLDTIFSSSRKFDSEITTPHSQLTRLADRELIYYSSVLQVSDTTYSLLTDGSIVAKSSKLVSTYEWLNPTDTIIKESYQLSNEYAVNHHTPGFSYKAPPAWRINFSLVNEYTLGVDFKQVTILGIPERTRMEALHNRYHDLPFGKGTPIQKCRGHSIYWDGIPAVDNGVEWPFVITPDGVDEDPRVLPWKTRYVVVNSLIVRRLSDDLEVEVTAFQIDMDPYLKEDGIKLSMYTKEDYDALLPTDAPVDIEVILNGYRRVFALTGGQETDQHLGSNFTVTGKSLTTYLGKPYHPPTSKVFDASLIVAQLVDAILQDTGWTATVEGAWGELIQGGTFSMSNGTPIAAIKTIAESLGLSVRPHAEDQHIDLELLYPITPLALEAAVKDYTISSGGIASMTHTLDRGEQANGVWVGGSDSGVFDQVVEQGTDGSTQLGAFISNLIQSHTLAEQKGIALLSHSKRKTKTSISLPLHEEIDVVAPNRTVEIEDAKYGNFLGYTRRVVINGRWARKALKVSQSVDIERS